MKTNPQESVCAFCKTAIRLTDNEWSIQGPMGTIPGAVCGECAKETISDENKKRGFSLYVSRIAIKGKARK